MEHNFLSHDRGILLTEDQIFGLYQVIKGEQLFAQGCQAHL